MQKPTIFTGVATLTEHEGNSIIISAGSLEALKGYLGESRAEGDPEICQVSITVGPRAEIVLDPVVLKSVPKED